MMSSYVFFTDEQKERANSVDLVDFLQRQGEKLIPSGRDKRLASDHSITVRGNRWYDHANQQGSYAIDLVKWLYNLSFPDAVSLLLGGEQGGTIERVALRIGGDDFESMADSLMALPELEQLNQRITVRYHLKPLPEDEVPAYIRHLK